jgi:multiple sugar transport system substrate-binding protein
MRPRHAFLTTLVSLAVLAGACTAGGGEKSTPTILEPSASHAPVTITLWTQFTDPEFGKLRSVLDDFEATYPWITVEATPGKQPQAVLRAMNSGTAPDVTMEPYPDDVAKYCSTGAWIDLNPYLDADHMDLTKVIPPGPRAYTSFEGNQCALPVLADAYGLYYNTDMFEAAGISSPPKTWSEFAEDAKKLTQLNADGSIKVAGFVPLSTFYENSNLYLGKYNGAEYYDADGESAIASDPGWAELIQFQKGMVDEVGFPEFQKFFAGLGGANSEWDSSQGFEQGKVAMTFDGEWRVAFIKNDKAPINYATAPFPVADGKEDLYGAGVVQGTTIGIPKGGAHEGEAWLLVKYLATDDHAEVKLGRALRNVPTTLTALKDPVLNNDPHFKTFLDVFSQPDSGFKQNTPIASFDWNTLQTFVTKYLGGSETDLQGGLEQVAKQIDDQQQIG